MVGSHGDIERFVTRNGGQFRIGRDAFRVESAERSYSLKKISSKELRFEVRNGDRVWPSDLVNGRERSEVRKLGNYGKDRVITLVYEFLLEPGNTTTVDWLCVGQWHGTDDPGEGRPPPWSFNINSGDIPQIVIFYGSYPNETKVVLWQGGKLKRNAWYKVKLKTKFRNNNSGVCRVWYEGHDIVNYHGPMGYDDSNYWKMGIYRGVESHPLAVRIKKFAIDDRM